MKRLFIAAVCLLPLVLGGVLHSAQEPAVPVADDVGKPKLQTPSLDPPSLDAPSASPASPVQPIRDVLPLGTPDVSPGSPAAVQPGTAPNAIDESVIKVFTLRNARAADAERIANQLFARDIQSIAVDERTNSLIVRGPDRDLNIIFALLTRLDEQIASQGAKPTGEDAAWQKPANTASLAELKKQYEAKERRTAELAKQIRDQQSGGRADKARLEKLSADLKIAVGEAFKARQQLHQAEAQELSNRVRRIHASLELRNNLSDQIIDRRVKDLLNPSLQWDSTSTSDARPRPPSATSAAKQWTGESTTQSGRPTVTFGSGRFSADFMRLCTKLGWKVRPVTADDVSNTRYFGSLMITEVDSTSPVGINAGDIILAMTLIGGFDNPQRVELQVLRDDKISPATIYFPASRAATTSRGTSSSPNRRGVERSATPAQDLSAARAYRDKLHELLEVIEQRYQAGRITSAEVLRAKVGLDDAEVLAAASADERQAARRQKVEHLKELKSALEALVRTGRQTPEELLAAEAELLKAEAELAAEFAPATSGQQSPEFQPAGNWAPSASGQTTILRPAEEFADRLRIAESRLNRLKETDVRQFGSPVGERERTPEEKAKAKEEMVNDAQRKLDFAREEYNAQIRLLEFDVRDASLALNTADRELKNAEALSKKQMLSQREVNEAIGAHEGAKLRVQRAETLLNLYRKADPKNEAASESSTPNGGAPPAKAANRSREL